jgi:hypothetical protein
MPRSTESLGHSGPLAYGAPVAGRAVCVSKATVWRLIAAGELRTFKLGARTLIRAGTVSAFCRPKPGRLGRYVALRTRCARYPPTRGLRKPAHGARRASEET